MITFKKRTFRQKLIFSYAAVIFAALTIFALFFLVRFVVTSAKQITLAIGDNASTMSGAITLRMEEVEMLLSTVHADKLVQDTLQAKDLNPDGSHNLSAINDLLLTRDLFRTKTRGIQIFAVEDAGYPNYGKVSLHNNAIYNDSQVAEMVWYKNARAANGVTRWSYNTDDIVAQVPNVFACRSIKKSTNPAVTLGVLRAVLSVENFTSVLRSSSAYEGGKAILYVDNTPISHLTDPMTADPAFLSLLPSLLSENGSSAFNAHFIASSRKVAGENWYVVQAVPTKALYSSVIPYAITVLVIWVALTLVTVLFCARLSAYFSSPLNELCDRMMEFGSQMDLQLPIRSDEEIERLYTSFNAMVTKIDELVKSEKLAERQKKQAEIRILQAQINPHFIYNTLESIKALAAKSNATEAVSMITAFGLFLRGSLNNGKHFTTIQKELEHVSSYVKIQQIRFCNSFTLQTCIEPEILQLITVNIILQPLVENCILHGFYDIDYQGVITLSGFLRDGMVVLQVADNGCGADILSLEAMLEKDFAGDGSTEKYYCLRNVWIRISRFFHDPSMKFLTNEQNGLTVEISFEPLTQYFDDSNA